MVSMFIKRMLSICLILVMIVAAQPIQAQEDDPEPDYLIEMMSMVPAYVGLVSQPGFLRIQYADMRANELARSGVPTPVDFAAYMNLDETNQELWRANLGRLIGLAEDLAIELVFDADMVNYLGLDYFEIDRSLEFGSRSDYGVIYGGHFDVDRIASTLTGRTYTTTDVNGMTVLCGPVGCERGNESGNWMPDLGKTDPLTFKRAGKYPLWGGSVGQQQPLALKPGYVLSTPEWEMMGMMTAAAEKLDASLYDVKAYRAVANFAVSGDPLIQVFFFLPSYFSAYYFRDLMLYGAGRAGDTDSFESLLRRFGVDATGRPLDAEDLPAYMLGALVDWQDGTDQVHNIVLVYANEADAQQAAAEVARRIPLHSAYPEYGKDQPLIDLAVSDYTIDPPQVVYDPDADQWLAIVAVRTPMPGNDPDPEHIPLSGRLLLYWYQSLVMMSNFMPVQLTSR
jgi:hypothetical protein